MDYRIWIVGIDPNFVRRREVNILEKDGARYQIYKICRTEIKC
jgi:hypothetical protein